MGLDSVELIFEIEKAFGVALPDEELEHTRTVGQLYRLLLDRLGAQATAKCRSQALFYRMRRVIARELGWHHRFIRPDTRVVELTSGGRTPVLAGLLQRRHWIPEVAWRPTRLERWLPLSVSLLIAATAAYLLMLAFGELNFVIGAVALGLAVPVNRLLHDALAPLRRELAYETMADLVREGVRHRLYTGADGAIDAPEIIGRARMLIADFMGIDPERVRPEVDFARDLGLD